MLLLLLCSHCAHTQRRKMMEDSRDVFAHNAAPSHDATEMDVGCPWTGPFERLEGNGSHVSLPCSSLFTHFGLFSAGHLKECDYEQMKCNYGCGVTLMRKALREHMQVCTWVIVDCDGCNGRVMLHTLPSHKAQSCPMRVVPCASGAHCTCEGERSIFCIIIIIIY